MGEGGNGNNQWEWEGNGIAKDILADLYVTVMYHVICFVCSYRRIIRSGEA